MIDFDNYKHMFSKDEIEFLKGIQNIAQQAYSNLKRNDNITDYIQHPEDIVNFLLNELQCKNLVYISVAYLHDVLEENEDYRNDYSKLLKDMQQQVGNIIWIVNNNIKDYYIRKIFYSVKKLTFNPTNENNVDKSLLKMKYIADMTTQDDAIFLIKVLDRLCNVLEFYKNKKYSYAKKYFCKGEVLFGECLRRINKFKNAPNVFSIKSLKEYNQQHLNWYMNILEFIKQVDEKISGGK